jgi:hypothetical protein
MFRHFKALLTAIKSKIHTLHALKLFLSERKFSLKFHKMKTFIGKVKLALTTYNFSFLTNIIFFMITVRLANHITFYVQVQIKNHSKQLCMTQQGSADTFELQ